MPNKTHYINFNVFECQTFVLQLQKHKFEEEFYDLIFTQPDDMQHNEYLNLLLYLIHQNTMFVFPSSILYKKRVVKIKFKRASNVIF